MRLYDVRRFCRTPVKNPHKTDYERWSCVFRKACDKTKKNSEKSREYGFWCELFFRSSPKKSSEVLFVLLKFSVVVNEEGIRLPSWAVVCKTCIKLLCVQRVESISLLHTWGMSTKPLASKIVLVDLCAYDTLSHNDREISNLFAAFREFLISRTCNFKKTLFLRYHRLCWTLQLRTQIFIFLLAGSVSPSLTLIFLRHSRRNSCFSAPKQPSHLMGLFDTSSSLSIQPFYCYVL